MMAIQSSRRASQATEETAENKDTKDKGTNESQTTGDFVISAQEGDSHNKEGSFDAPVADTAGVSLQRGYEGCIYRCHNANTAARPS